MKSPRQIARSVSLDHQGRTSTTPGSHLAHVFQLLLSVCPLRLPRTDSRGPTGQDQAKNDADATVTSTADSSQLQGCWGHGTRTHTGTHLLESDPVDKAVQFLSGDAVRDSSGWLALSATQ